jgi:hypothetical protein
MEKMETIIDLDGHSMEYSDYNNKYCDKLIFEMSDEEEHDKTNNGKKKETDVYCPYYSLLSYVKTMNTSELAKCGVCKCRVNQMNSYAVDKYARICKRCFNQDLSIV